jgi:hypothetical protein
MAERSVVVSYTTIRSSRNPKFQTGKSPRIVNAPELYGWGVVLVHPAVRRRGLASIGGFGSPYWRA